MLTEQEPWQHIIQNYTDYQKQLTAIISWFWLGYFWFINANII